MGKESITDDSQANYYRVLCPCCDGKRFQTNKQTGIKEICKCCNGSGIDPPTQIKTTSAEWGGSKEKEIRG